ncbi:hypothetical protein [Effusibacillus dendaii]|uniref:MarR family transcriptional regulator n=1 Tax=Effusibacillus dendaii TaxID=2743772 RepID=A0A7I8DGW9_9BACL|nr:hypothetical protein [Effusibacillus dendaii]BCJ87820.1 hypothetical protein skT53_28050 [Effusibacillus dendaii]
MDILQQIAQLMVLNNKIFFTIMAHELAKCGITIPQAVVLDTIKASPAKLRIWLIRL